MVKSRRASTVVPRALSSSAAFLLLLSSLFFVMYSVVIVLELAFLQFLLRLLDFHYVNETIEKHCRILRNTSKCHAAFPWVKHNRSVLELLGKFQCLCLH